MKWLRMLVTAAAAGLMANSCMVVGCIEGLHGANPKTVIRADPATRSIYVENNKDVDVTIEEASYNHETKEFKLKNAKIVDNASTVRASNVQQIDAWTREATAHYAGIVNWSNSFWSGLNQFAAEVAPYVPQTVMASALSKFRSVATPLGSYQAGLSSEAQAAIVAEIQAAVRAATRPATAPAG